jgi:gliding motility-associated-like protein
MKKISKLFLTIFACVIAMINNASATHVAGADITYVNVGVDSFLVTVNIFEDCGGAATVGSTITVAFVDGCNGNNFNSTFNQTSVSEVSQLCAFEQPNSTCNGGSLPGMRQKVYQKIVELPGCNAWKITWGIANRNASVNLDPPGNTLFFAVNALLNNADAPDNNSPTFNSQPIPYVCANQLVNYSFGVSETDGDSLVYSFTDPLGGSLANPTPLTYQPGFSTAQPLPGISIDPVTGLLTFTPTVIGSFVVVVMVEEFRNGILVGFVKRDIQFVVRSCVNTAPDINAGEITNVNGDAVQTGPFTLEMCEGNTFSFTSTYTDQDPADTLTIISNINSVLPGSQVTTSGINPLIINVTWTAPAGSSGQNNSFSLTVSDGACPIPGIQNFVYTVEVVPSTFIIPNSAVICGNDSLQLQAIGGTDFTWYDLNGNQIIPSAEFSCNNCPDPIVKPLVTTSYVVKSNLSNTCVNRDTIVVTIAPDFSVIVAASDSIVCAGETIQLTNITLGGGAPYSYSWLPASSFNNPIASNPTATLNNPGLVNLILNATSAQGCLRSDTVEINVVPSPIFTIPPYGPYCANAPIVDLEYNVANPNYFENWSGNGIVNPQSGTFDPSLAGAGNHIISLVLTVPGATCTGNQSVTINVQAAPDATLDISDSVFCSTDTSIQLITTSPGGIWSSNPSGFITNGTFSPNSAPIGITELIYSFGGTCPDADTVSVLVNQTPQVPIITQNQINCTGDFLPYGAITATGISGGTINWFNNESLQGLVNTGNTYNGQFNSNATVYAYDSLNGCVSNTASLYIAFNPTPIAEFTVDPPNGNGTTPFLVSFSNNSTNFSSWIWNFGDSTAFDSTNFNATHTFAEGGIFRVILTTSNTFGCVDTVGFTIVALEEMVIPNVFTPNGDGSNDEFYFKVDPNSVNSFKATIFDRWGKKVTEFGSVKDKWDGGNYPAGTYYYIIEASDINNQPFKHTHGYFKMMK